MCRCAWGRFSISHSLLPPRGSSGLNWVYHAWRQAPSPAEPSLWPRGSLQIPAAASRGVARNKYRLRAPYPHAPQGLCTGCDSGTLRPSRALRPTPLPPPGVRVPLGSQTLQAVFGSASRLPWRRRSSSRLQSLPLQSAGRPSLAPSSFPRLPPPSLLREPRGWGRVAGRAGNGKGRVSPAGPRGGGRAPGSLSCRAGEWCGEGSDPRRDSWIRLHGPPR